SRAYCIQVSYAIRGHLDLEAFRRSWQELSRRHALLRTAFIHDGVDRPLQVVFCDRAVPFRVVTDVDTEYAVADLESRDLAAGLGRHGADIWKGMKVFRVRQVMKWVLRGRKTIGSIWMAGRVVNCATWHRAWELR